MLPLSITSAPLRTVRPQQLSETYTQPVTQLHRWVRAGRMNRLAHGIYYAIPDDQPPGWVPGMEAATAAVATAMYGDRVPVLMHLTAARALGAVPRAVAVGVVAVPHQHRPITLTDREHGRVIFVARDVTQLDAVLVTTSLGPALATTPEQTILDLAKRPALTGNLDMVAAAITALRPRVDMDRVRELAAAQHAPRALNALRDTGTP